MTTKDPLAPKSFKVGVRVRGSESLLFNALRFSERGEAEAYASDLEARWREVTGTEITHSFEEPNAHFPVPSDRYVFNRKPHLLEGGKT